MKSLFTKQDIQQMIDKGFTLNQIQEEIGFDNIGQGFGYKSEEAFLIGASSGYEDKYLCYIPEGCYHDLPDGSKQISLDSCYTRKDFIELTKNKDNAEALFEAVDWQHPSSLWEEWDTELMPVLSTEPELPFEENAFHGDYFQVKKALEADYWKDDVELASFFETCKAPDLSIEDVVRLYADLKLEIDGDAVVEFKEGTIEVKALWSIDEPFYSKEEITYLFSKYVEDKEPLTTNKDYLFWHMDKEEFKEAWKVYKDETEELMEETPVAKVSFENVELYVALEKDEGNEYITFFTTLFKDGEWGTEDFFNDETERNLKVKTALATLNWDNLENIMSNMLQEYCRDKNIALSPYSGKSEMELNVNIQQHNNPSKDYSRENFIDDKAKMRDFVKLSKEEFLQSYSYLTEEEYENTRLLMQKKTFVINAIFDDEVLINDDHESLNGYLWSVDSLVDRLPSSENMENIKFFADYNLRTGEVKLTATYDTPVEDGALNKSFDVPLSSEDKLELIYAFEQYCQDGRYGKTCLELVNETRVEEGLEPLGSYSKKPSLADQLRSAESKSGINKSSTTHTNTFEPQL